MEINNPRTEKQVQDGRSRNQYDLGPLRIFRSIIWFDFKIVSPRKVRNGFGM